MAQIVLLSGLSLRNMTVCRDVGTGNTVISAGLSLRRMSVNRGGNTGSENILSSLALQRQSVNRGGGGHTGDIVSRGVSAGFGAEIFGVQQDALKDMSSNVTRVV